MSRASERSVAAGMRVAHVNPDPGIAPGRRKGAAVHVEALRRALGELGAEVVALDVPDDEALRRALEQEEARSPLDVVYERHALGRFAAGEFARARGIPHVLEVNAPLALEAELYRAGSPVPATPERERELFAGATVLAVSREVARYAVARGAGPRRVRVVPNAVDPELFRPRAPGDATRAALVPAGRFAVGFHGRLRPWHHFELLVEAAAALCRRGCPVHLVVLGEGEFEASLRGRLPDDRWTRVAWLPHDEAARVVAAFDAVALSYAPGAPCWFSPLKLLEAMSVGAVPVVPALGDLEEAVEHGVDGLVYRAGDLDALVAAIERLVEEPGLRDRLGLAARARAERHTWRDVARLVLEATCARRSA